MQQYDLNFGDYLYVDNFAGGGGTSTGMESGLNRPIDIAINHDPVALAVHELNHPHTMHVQSDVFEVDPIEVCGGKPVGAAWFSPDCRHFSKAKGKCPVKRKVRGLAWVARRWAKTVKPEVIFLENVKEFLSWGPTIPRIGVDGKPTRDEDGEIEMTPDPARKSLTFKAFNAWFERNGYKAEYKILKACDYGAPTIRERLFWIARCDGLPIVWPEPTHGPKNSPLTKKNKLKPYRTAAECIDWDIPCPSIFMDKKEVKIFNKAKGTRIRRPLADATLTRIAKGVCKYVLNNGDPFIVPIANYGSGGVVAQPIDEPLRTITAYPKGGSFAVISPCIAPIANYSSGVVVDSGDEPLRTMTVRNNLAVFTPFMARPFGESIGHPIDEPTGTITANGGGKCQLISPVIARQFGTGACHSVNEPLRTITAGGGGGKNQLVSAFLAKHYTGVVGSDLRAPLGTVTSVDHHSVVEATLSQTDIESGALQVAAFLIKYYGQGIGQDITEPLHTLSTRDRFGLVTVMIRGEPWMIVDIGMRMLKPHELKIAQGFPADYNLGDGTIGEQVRLIGNSVPPQFAEALTRANITDLRQWKQSA